MSTDTSYLPGRSIRAGSPAAGVEKRNRWLILVHQLPTSPSKARVQTWRRLQQLGAVSVRNAVYVLPDSAQAREDFEWMKGEILANRGEATVFAADTIDSLAHDDIVAAFRADRARLFGALREEIEAVSRTVSAAVASNATQRRRLHRTVRQLGDRLATLAASDFFRAGGREEAHAALGQLERLLVGPAPGITAGSDAATVLRAEDYRGKTWFTRPRPGIDRAGSAWFVRRFIDPRARFAFSEKVPTSTKAVPFDMYDVEFSHHGSRCTFEVLSARFGVADQAVDQLARLVHDLDLKEDRYHVPEAPTIGRLIDGLRQSCLRDDELIEHGIVLFEALYRAYRSGGPAETASAARRRSGRARKRR